MISLLIIFFLIALLFSFLCSLWEAVLLSITPSYAQIKLNEGSAVGKKLQVFKENIDQPLAAILTLNTIAHTVGALGVGAQAAQIWADSHPAITGFIVPALMTFAILVFSELIPKTLGANHWKELSNFTVQSLSLLIKALYPLVWFSQLLTKMLKKEKVDAVFTRSDFLAMAELGTKEGVFEQTESHLINNLLQFNTVLASDVMTPRTVVVKVDAGQSISEFYQAHQKLRFSRIPVYETGHSDHIQGFILKTEMLEKLLGNEGDQLVSEILRPIPMIPENHPIPDLFNDFLEKNEHIAVVVDEFGGMSGIVTMEDVIETMLGREIIDEMDHTTDMRELARKRWKRRAAKSGLIEPEKTTES
ncbi:HlyC/CorC family transporter [Leucothrix sargassi]|nr:HlyC/CorC family transporter [Leucothrix sargassi]